MKRTLKVSLSIWIAIRKRDHGNLLFIDLRDHYGLTQCVIENKVTFSTKKLNRIRTNCCWQGC